MFCRQNPNYSPTRKLQSLQDGCEPLQISNLETTNLITRWSAAYVTSTIAESAIKVSIVEVSCIERKFESFWPLFKAELRGENIFKPELEPQVSYKLVTVCKMRETQRVDHHELFNYTLH